MNLCVNGGVSELPPKNVVAESSTVTARITQHPCQSNGGIFLSWPELLRFLDW